MHSGAHGLFRGLLVCRRLRNALQQVIDWPCYRRATSKYSHSPICENSEQHDKPEYDSDTYANEHSHQ